MNDDLLGLASYIVRWANLFFRIIRSEGNWIEGSACAAAKSAGMEMNYTWIKHYQTLYIISYVSWMYRFFLWFPWLKPSLWDLLCWTVLNQGGFCSFSSEVLPRWLQAFQIPSQVPPRHAHVPPYGLEPIAEPMLFLVYIDHIFDFTSPCVSYNPG